LILNQEPEDARKFREDITDRLLDILEKLISKDREDRYEVLGLMIDDLRDVMNEKEIETYQFELPAPKPSQSIAVLPFINMSADPEQEYFCDGLTEELINALSKIQDLKVVARTSAFIFKGGSYDVRKIGRKLDVKTILEGSVRKSDNQLRIIVQLINVMDGYHLWSEKYDRELKDIFKIQEDISLSIVDILKIKLQEVEKEKLTKRFTDNIRAYNLCQQGISLMYLQLNQSVINKAIEYFHQALEEDPYYILAMVGLAGCDFNMAYFGLKRSSDAFQNSKKYLERIFKIDECSSEGFSMLGYAKACYEWDWNEAKSAWQHSLELNPNNLDALQGYSINRVSWGEFDLARKLTRRAKTIDPLAPYTEICCAFPDFYTARYNKVMNNLSKYLELHLSTSWWGLWYLWRTLSIMNRSNEAAEACRISFITAGLNDIAQVMDKAGSDNAIYTAASSLAEIYKYHYVSPYDIAILFSHAGKQYEALNWVEKSVEEVDPKLHWLNVDPEWQSVRNDERFIKCLKTIGFITSTIGMSG
ncbi:MAG: hypothetical protein WCE54_00770, partial [Ignavibacteriaceae bacterium]